MVSIKKKYVRDFLGKRVVKETKRTIAQYVCAFYLIPFALWTNAVGIC